MPETNPMTCDPDRFQVLSFDHLTIIVGDLEATKQFYSDLLGLAVVTRPKFDFPGAWFQLGNVVIHATVASLEAGTAGPGNISAARPSRGPHFAFQVSSVTTAAKELALRGVDIVAGPQERPDGAQQLYIADPDGHIVELFSVPAT